MRMRSATGRRGSDHRRHPRRAPKPTRPGWCGSCCTTTRARPRPCPSSSACVFVPEANPDGLEQRHARAGQRRRSQPQLANRRTGRRHVRAGRPTLLLRRRRPAATVRTRNGGAGGVDRARPARDGRLLPLRRLAWSWAARSRFSTGLVDAYLVRPRTATASGSTTRSPATLPSGSRPGHPDRSRSSCGTTSTRTSSATWPGSRTCSIAIETLLAADPSYLDR